jgi:glycosyltransferase involved in cell wall biosynthesis
VRRLLFVIGSLEVGGAEQHLVRVAAELKARGWSPEVFVFVTGGPLSVKLSDEEIPIYGISIRPWFDRINNLRLRAGCRLIATAALLCWTMLQRRPAIVHFFLPSAYIIGGFAALLTITKPRVMSRRSRNHYQINRPVCARIEFFLHSKMERVCANSHAVMLDLAGEGISKEKLCLIHNGVDVHHFSTPTNSAKIRTELNLIDGVLVLICVANLIPYKGHIDLIEALSLANERIYQPWVCLCVGRDDGIGAALKVYAERLGIGGSISWLGSRSDIPDLLACADIGILCSHEEGFSNAVLEGMAAGLPMVVTDVGGNAEAVIDGVHGRVVPALHPRVLADAIVEIASNPSRRAMGMLGRQRVLDDFSFKTCVNKYENMYVEIIGSDF